MRGETEESVSGSSKRGRRGLAFIGGIEQYSDEQGKWGSSI